MSLLESLFLGYPGIQTMLWNKFLQLKARIVLHCAALEILYLESASYGAL